ncbi:MAG: hypothetical protein ACXWNQ_06180 [Anaerolineales bacterium]
MLILVAGICLLLLLALAGADLFVADISPDELSNMGVERKA